MSKPEFVYTTYIKTTPDKLWHALTDREFTHRYWMNCTLTSDWKAGSRMTMERGGEVKNECVILESDPPRKLSYSWVSIFDEDMKKEKPSRVTYMIEPRGDMVKLVVTHEGFADGVIIRVGRGRGARRKRRQCKGFFSHGHNSHSPAQATVLE